MCNIRETRRKHIKGLYLFITTNTQADRKTDRQTDRHADLFFYYCTNLMIFYFCDFFVEISLVLTTALCIVSVIILAVVCVLLYLKIRPTTRLRYTLVIYTNNC